MLKVRALAACGAFLLTLKPPVIRRWKFLCSPPNIWENYLNDAAGHRQPKIQAARADIQISANPSAPLNPARPHFEDMDNTNALLEVRASLKSEGLDFPFWEQYEGVRRQHPP
jgi:hypothetical protein